MSTHDEDLAIIDAAESDASWQESMMRGVSKQEQAFSARFNTTYCRQLVEENKAMRDALQKVLDDCELGIIPRSHLDAIARILN